MSKMPLYNYTHSFAHLPQKTHHRHGILVFLFSRCSSIKGEGTTTMAQNNLNFEDIIHEKRTIYFKTISFNMYFLITSTISHTKSPNSQTEKSLNLISLISSQSLFITNWPSKITPTRIFGLGYEERRAVVGAGEKSIGKPSSVPGESRPYYDLLLQQGMQRGTGTGIGAAREHQDQNSQPWSHFSQTQ